MTSSPIGPHLIAVVSTVNVLTTSFHRSSFFYCTYFESSWNSTEWPFLCPEFFTYDYNQFLIDIIALQHFISRWAIYSVYISKNQHSILLNVGIFVFFSFKKKGPLFTLSIIWFLKTTVYTTGSECLYPLHSHLPQKYLQLSLVYIFLT